MSALETLKYIVLIPLAWLFVICWSIFHPREIWEQAKKEWYK